MKTTYDIKKIDCQSCALMIEGICEDLAGVRTAEVNARQRQLVVEHEPTVTASDIVSALTAGGYPVEQRPE
jgi:copper chaperone CopZ